MTRVEALAAFFTANPNTWIDGMTLGEISGVYAWRSRVSEIRRSPWRMSIENRQRKVTRSDGSHYIVSEYRYVPETVKSVTTETTQETTGNRPLLF